MPSPEILEQTPISNPEQHTFTLRGVFDKARQIVGRVGLATSLLLGGGITAVEMVTDQTPVAAAETGGYPWADASHISDSIARDNITWGYANKTDCDGKSSAYDCSGAMIGRYYFRDPWGYDIRNCTSYVAWRVAKEFGVSVAGWGNADTWDNNASGKYTVDTTPEPGDIAVWDSMHVAFVEAVNSNGSVKVSQYNAGLDGNYSTANRRANHYIDINGTGKGLDSATPANPAPAGLNGVTAISSQVENGTQHVYWASADGTLRETWFRPGVVHTNTIQKFGHAITALSSQYTASDMIQHVYVGTEEGSIYETWFGPNSNGYHTWMTFDSDTPITALASNPPFDGNQHVYWATQGGRVGETWFHPGTVNSWQAFQSNSPIHGLSAQYTPRDGVQHLYWGNDEGRLHETWFRPGVVNTNLMAQFPEPITSVSSQTSPDGTQHVYSGDKDNRMRETWFNASSHGYNTWEAGVFGDDVSALSSQITPDGTQHVYSSAGNSISETWFYPGTVNGWSAAQSGSRVTAISSQYTSADGVQHVYWGAEDGKVRETWFRPGIVNTWELPS